MNADDQTPRHGEPTDAPPSLPQAAADREHAGHTEPGAAPDPAPDVITTGNKAPAGAPQQRIHEQGPDTEFWNLLSHAERTTLQELGHVSAFRAGETICTEGEKTTDVFVLTEGWVKVLSAAREHRGIVLALRGGGDIVGELAAHAAGYRTATVVTIGPVQALVVTHDRFTLFLDSSQGANRAYRHVMTQRWLEVAETLRSRSANNGTQRLAGLLLDLAARYGTPAESGTAITIPLSQEEIASLAGTSRATVTRALRHWRRSGLIGTTRHPITIKNAPGLRTAAGRDTDPHAPLAGR